MHEFSGFVEESSNSCSAHEFSCSAEESIDFVESCSNSSCIFPFAEESFDFVESSSHSARFLMIDAVLSCLSDKSFCPDSSEENLSASGGKFFFCSKSLGKTCL